MISPGSRYEQADRQFAYAHIYDQHGFPVLTEDKTKLRFRTENREATYLMTTLPLPPAPPLEYFAKDGEHMPFLAYKFLSDSKRWWEIAEVNPQIWYPLDLMTGSYIRVPS